MGLIFDNNLFLRALALLLLAAFGVGLWRRGRKSLGWKGIALLCVVVVLGGWGVALWMERAAVRREKSRLLEIAVRVSGAISTERVHALAGAESDLTQRDYQRVKEQLQSIRKEIPKARFVYALRQVQGKAVFLADSELAGSSSESPPGQVYDEASEELLASLAAGHPLVEGPSSDRWGTFISALVPLRDGCLDAAPMMLGIDVDAEEFNTIVAVERWKGIILVLLAGLVALAMAILKGRIQEHVAQGGEGRPLPPMLRWGGASVVVGIGLFATTVAYHEMHVSSKARFESLFHERAADQANVLINTIRESLRNLESVNRFLDGSESVEREEFTCFAKPMVVHQAGLQSFGWVRRVKREQRHDCEVGAHREGIAEYGIYEFNSQGRKIPAGDRDEHFPLYYLEPLASQRAALGFDLATNPVRRRAMETACDTGEMVATEALHLIGQPEPKVDAIIVFIPRYEKNRPHATVAQRRESLIGFVIGGFRLSLLNRSIERSTASTWLAHSLEDLSAEEPARLTYQGQPGSGHVDWKAANFPTRFTRTLEVGGRDWRITIVPGTEFIARNLWTGYRWIVPAGLLASVLVGMYANLVLTGRIHAETAVRSRTAELAMQKSRLQLHFDRMPVGCIVLDNDGQVQMWNPAAERIFGHDSPEAMGRPVWELVAPARQARDARSVWRDLLRGDLSASATGRFLTRQGREIWCQWTNTPLHDDRGNPVGVILMVEDISGRKAMEDELRAAARTDRLTGLPNRALFLDRLQQAILRHKRLPAARFAILYLDFDRFKTVNDSLGHDVGDELLRQIAARLHDSLRAVDSVSRMVQGTTAARLGGDEFVILLDIVRGGDDARLVADRLLAVLGTPFKVGAHEIVSTASIGIVTSDFGHDRAEEVLRDADTAMYEAKLSGRGRAMVFDASMRDRVRRKMELENGLRKALETGQLEVQYQPIISLETRLVEGFEALLRWQHPEHGVISPGEFIPVAEETGLIVGVGEFVFRQACAQLAAWWNKLGRRAVPSISVNLSRNQLAVPELPILFRQIALDAGIEPEAVHLEVTESAIMSDAGLAARMIRDFRAFGFKVDMDDFGTGYSSLACLHQFPIDVLKVDRSFIANMDRGRDFAALVNAIAMLARNLGISVIAEGVETESQVIMLQAMECQMAQGYFFARPMPPAQVEMHLARQSAASNAA